MTSPGEAVEPRGELGDVHFVLVDEDEENGGMTDAEAVAFLERPVPNQREVADLDRD